MSLETRDTYQGAWYLLNGAELVSVKVREIPPNIRKKRGYFKEWIVVLDNVPEESVEKWRTGQAICNVQDLARERRRLKRQINRLI